MQKTAREREAIKRVSGKGKGREVESEAPLPSPPRRGEGAGPEEERGVLAEERGSRTRRRARSPRRGEREPDTKKSEGVPAERGEPEEVLVLATTPETRVYHLRTFAAHYVDARHRLDPTSFCLGLPGDSNGIESPQGN